MNFAQTLAAHLAHLVCRAVARGAGADRCATGRGGRRGFFDASDGLDIDAHSCAGEYSSACFERTRQRGPRRSDAFMPPLPPREISAARGALHQACVNEVQPLVDLEAAARARLVGERLRRGIDGLDGWSDAEAVPQAAAPAAQPVGAPEPTPLPAGRESLARAHARLHLFHGMLAQAGDWLGLTAAAAGLPPVAALDRAIARSCRLGRRHLPENEVANGLLGRACETLSLRLADTFLPEWRTCSPAQHSALSLQLHCAHTLQIGRTTEIHGAVTHPYHGFDLDGLRALPGFPAAPRPARSQPHDPRIDHAFYDFYEAREVYLQVMWRDGAGAAEPLFCLPLRAWRRYETLRQGIAREAPETPPDRAHACARPAPGHFVAVARDVALHPWAASRGGAGPPAPARHEASLPLTLHFSYAYDEATIKRAHLYDAKVSREVRERESFAPAAR